MMQILNTSKIVLALILIGILLAPVAQAIASSARSAEEAISIAVEQNGGKGKVLGVRDKVSESGDPYYEIKIILDGKVRIFRVGKN